MDTEKLTQLNREWSPGRETGPDAHCEMCEGSPCICAPLVDAIALHDKIKVQWIDDLGKVVRE